MEGKICCFSGHSQQNDTEKIYRRVAEEAEKLILNENVREFWVGHYGMFDAVSARCVAKLKEKYPFVRLILIVPYLSKNLDNSDKRFDWIEIAEIPAKTPKRFMISKCNEYMVDGADFMICCTEFSCGGAAKTLEYAKKRLGL